jgi:hypothetical protein
MGDWQTKAIGYLEPYDVVCALCGQLVPGRHWVEDVDGAQRTFCDPRHADLYESYWLPRYGGRATVES